MVGGLIRRHSVHSANDLSLVNRDTIETKYHFYASVPAPHVLLLFGSDAIYYNILAEEASALMELLTNNHAFVDRNKRIAFAATDTFVRLNGYYLDVEAKSTHDFMTEKIARGEFRFGLISEWIFGVMRPLSEEGANK